LKDRRHLIGAFFEKLADECWSSCAIVLTGRALDGVREGTGIVTRTWMIEDALASVSRNVEHPHQLAGVSRAAALLGDLGCNRHLTRGDEHHPPHGSSLEMRIPVQAAFAGTCRDLVGAGGERLGIGHPDLVEHQEAVGVLRRRDLEGVGGLPPGQDEA
jgi:hypothetical protein